MNTDARLQCQMSVIEAMKAVGHGVPIGASHRIGHQLRPLEVGHGEMSCILLPAVCRYNAERKVNVERQEKVKEIFWGCAEVEDVLTARGLVEGRHSWRMCLMRL